MDEGSFSMGVGPIDKDVVDDDYAGGGIPLSDTTRLILIVLHYGTFVVVTAALYAYVQKFEAIKSRIHSPFLLLLAIGWLQVGPAFEIGNHFYVNNWHLYDSQADLVNASFSFFNFGSQNVLAFSLRKKGRPLFQMPVFRLGSIKEDLLELVVSLVDLLLVILTIAQPFVYNFLGREASVSFLSPMGAVAGFLTLNRLWKNLGPNVYTKYGGILFFVLALCGVVALMFYRSSNNENVHIFIGGSFVSSVIPFTVALYNAEAAAQGGDEETGQAEYGGTGESAPLVSK